MVEHRIHWTSPEPFWSGTAAAAEAGVDRPYEQPVILRFTTDTFMDDFLAMLEKDPEQLPSLLAQPETWQGPLNPSSDVTGSGPAPKVPKLVRKLERLRLASGRSSSESSATVTSSGSILSKKNNAGIMKLYQPAHQRYYLVSACLVCGMTGMPDREVDPGREERVSFVIRRMLPPGELELGKPLPAFNSSTWEEYAYVVSPNGAGWKKIGDVSNPAVETLITGEEPLPLFAVNYDTGDDRSRRLFAGLVPVGRREAYMAAGAISGEDGPQSSERPLPKTSRMILFRSQVAEPWKNVIDQAERFKKIVDPELVKGFTPDSEPPLKEVPLTVKAAQEQIQTQSWLILLDLARYLHRYVPEVWQAILDSGKESALKDPNQRNLLNALQSIETTQEIREALGMPPYSPNDVKSTLPEALKGICGEGDVMEDKVFEHARVSYNRQNKGGDWPEFLFPLADPLEQALNFPEDAGKLSEDDEVNVVEHISTAEADEVRKAKGHVDSLLALMVRAMPTDSAVAAPPVPVASQPVKDTREGIFVIRAVFERPNCGPLRPTVVSERSRPFRMAGFFDPDAPARPIRIALPIDTSPGGLRKFDKNTAFMISDVLCGQIQRAKGLSFGDLVLSVLPWPFHKDLPVPDAGPCQSSNEERLGMICTLSIPIITICALILLTIIVNLLDIIFRWVPYFIMCFPLPGFKAKR